MIFWDCVRNYNKIKTKDLRNFIMNTSNYIVLQMLRNAVWILLRQLNGSSSFQFLYEERIVWATPRSNLCIVFALSQRARLRLKSRSLTSFVERLKSFLAGWPLHLARWRSRSEYSLCEVRRWVSRLTAQIPMLTGWGTIIREVGRVLVLPRAHSVAQSRRKTQRQCQCWLKDLT